MLDVLIIGGGISGLTVAHAAGLADRPGKWELWESTERLGGTIGTDRAEGYSVDWGPNGFLDREPLTLRFVDEIGLREALEPANPKSEKRFIVKHGRLHPVPFSPGRILATGLLRPVEKARIFCEPFIPARRDDGDESVFDFAARRIGRGAAETFVDPMVSGVHGGLARELSLPSCFPVMREMEMRYGGLVKALVARQLAKRRAARAAGPAQRKSGGPAGPGGRLTSFKSGFDVVIRRLEERLRPGIRMNREAARIRRGEGGWEALDRAGNTVLARNVVISCPTYAAAEFVKDFDEELSDALAAIPYAPIIVVATGHRREDVENPLDGFGFLIPRNQAMRTLGSIWTSSIFSERAPEGFVQFRSMLGGDGDHDVLRLPDDRLWDTLREEIGPLLGIRKDPAFMRVFRWKHGIPQFKMGHRERRARIEQRAARHPGLYLAGNAYYGVGLNDCVKTAYRAAERIAGG